MPKVGVGFLEGVNIRMNLAGRRGGQEHMGVVMLTLRKVVIKCRSQKYQTQGKDKPNQYSAEC